MKKTVNRIKPEEIKEFRKKMKYTQQDLSNIIHIDLTSIYTGLLACFPCVKGESAFCVQPVVDNHEINPCVV